MMTKRAFLMIVSSAVALALSACDPDPAFMECPLSTRILQVCAEQNEGSDTFTCVVEDHPFCLERTCASWEGQPSLCTRVCTSNDQCDVGSQCVTDDVLKLSFCILDTHVEAAAAGIILEK